MPPPPKPTLIYHITHVDNLASIIGAGGLLSFNGRAERGLDYTNVAHRHIRHRRGSKVVPLPPGGNLNDYVPWYFGPRSPMLCAIQRGSVQSVAARQADIVHLVAHAQDLDRYGIPWLFTDGHAEMHYANFYTNEAEFARVDWPLMEATWWNDTHEDPNRKFRRQAEFLAHREVPWRLVRVVGVQNARAAQRVETTLAGTDHKPEIWRRPRWYYE